jgi:hypothetical protein
LAPNNIPPHQKRFLRDRLGAAFPFVERFVFRSFAANAFMTDATAAAAAATAAALAALVATDWTRRRLDLAVSTTVLLVFFAMGLLRFMSA